MAYEQSLPSPWKAKTFSKILFSKYEIPTSQNNYALCKVSIFQCSSHVFQVSACNDINEAGLVRMPGKSKCKKPPVLVPCPPCP